MSRQKLSEYLKPLSPENQQLLDECVKEALPYADQIRKNILKLIPIVAKLPNTYGDTIVERWAEQIGVSSSLAYEWRKIGKALSSHFLEDHGPDLSIAKLKALAILYWSGDPPAWIIEKIKDPKVYAREIYTLNLQELDTEQEKLALIKKENNYNMLRLKDGGTLQEDTMRELEKLAETEPWLAREILEYKEIEPEVRAAIEARNLNDMDNKLALARKATSQLQSAINFIEKNKEMLDEALSMHLIESDKLNRRIHGLVELLGGLDTYAPEPLTKPGSEPGTSPILQIVENP